MTELPKDLAEVLQTQDNRITADPLFVVQREQRVYGMDPMFGNYEDFIWIKNGDPEDFYESEDESELIKNLALEHPDEPNPTCINPEKFDYERSYYSTHWEFVNAHFTERAALKHISENLHNLGTARVYVTSQYRCPEWNAVRKFLMERRDEGQEEEESKTEESLARITEMLESNLDRMSAAQCHHPKEDVEVTSRAIKERVDLDCRRCQSRMSLDLKGIQWILKYKSELALKEDDA